MTADATGARVTLTDLGSSLHGGDDDTIVFTRDGSGTYVWVSPNGPASISFRFVSTRRAEGTAVTAPGGGSPCAATWPFGLDRL